MVDKLNFLSSFNLATQLTIARMGLSIPIGVFLWLGWGWLAALLIILAALTDFLDGYFARSRDEVSPIGAALDPIADKLVAVATLIGFVAAGTLSGLNVIAVFAILLRETLVSGLRESAAEWGGLSVTGLAKTKTTVQFVAFIALCFGPNLISLGLFWAATILTVLTGWHYSKEWWSSAKSGTEHPDEDVL